MSEAILIFTFSPVQSFIGEARRASDLFASSKILSRLSYAAARSLKTNGVTMIYPANPNSNDMPNKLVARVPFDRARSLAEQAQAALEREWQEIAESARKVLTQAKPKPDAVWDQIWKRQVGQIWEIYWVAQRMDKNYAQTYSEASRALDAVKRTRWFLPSEEDGLKDTLSGKRSALRTNDQDAREYWKQVAKNFPAAQVRPEGKERLDALGAVKRFCDLAGGKNFLSVSSVATQEYLATAQKRSPQALKDYRQAVEHLLGSHLYRVRPEPDWPYDGDLFFLETLEANRLKDSYRAENLDHTALEAARQKLKTLYSQVGAPSPYFALLELDGDSMGMSISACQQEDQHQDFSQQLAKFAELVPGIVTHHFGELIYNGGDDVLVLAPLTQAIPLAQKLAELFAAKVKQPPNFEVPCSLSAGIAVAHHLYPLDAVRQAALRALTNAKNLNGKSAVSVRVLKRSGEQFDLRSYWKSIGSDAGGQTNFEKCVQLFQDIQGKGSPLASRFAYDVLEVSRILSASDEKFESELRRLLKRHRNKKNPELVNVAECSDRLLGWAKELPGKSEELGRWLVFARFVAQGGGE
ncbi:MAG: type III-B CRISPR-associated protein Cas10/Cmr2 [Anaerolineales bacterium]|nr:type III-B CRISPR-associated protein Cas10/Cmr2 [Anaerolineales bacterium]MDW8162863.1 type III-B CRISPR-associated protein Cas10/Cmr2 [Anaerolineales bacterium]